MGDNIEMHKAGGIILKDRKFLVCRAEGKEFFVAPGGKLETGESAKQALVRELNEELGIVTIAESLREFGTFYAPAAGEENVQLQMDVFMVNEYSGEIKASSEIEELLWINSSIPTGVKLGSIFEHEVLPRLKVSDLID